MNNISGVETSHLDTTYNNMYLNQQGSEKLSAGSEESPQKIPLQKQMESLSREYLKSNLTRERI